MCAWLCRKDCICPIFSFSTGIYKAKVVFHTGPRSAFWLGSDTDFVSSRNWRTMKTNMWSLESVSLSARESSTQISSQKLTRVTSVVCIFFLTWKGIKKLTWNTNCLKKTQRGGVKEEELEIEKNSENKLSKTEFQNIHILRQQVAIWLWFSWCKTSDKVCWFSREKNKSNFWIWI